jgi:hypothetical protein
MKLTGGTWKPMAPPAVDSLGQSYSCTDAVRNFPLPQHASTKVYRLEMCITYPWLH